MSKIDQEFASLCRKIMIEGKEYENKNRGVKRLQIPSYTFRHEFKDGFPAITNKKLYWKGIVGELIWFLRGDNDVKYLNDNGIKIWNKDAYNWYKKQTKELHSADTMTFEEFEAFGRGSVGQNYSVQWRKFNGVTDQIKELIDTMHKDIMSSRLKVNAWNPSEVDLTALPPCHSEFQVIGVPLEDDKFGFELHWNQRSVDTFLGLPFNIASYGLLAKIIEDLTGFKALAIEGTLKCVHFYDNQYEAVAELLKRNPDKHPNCELEIKESDYAKPVNIDKVFYNYSIKDFKLVGYTSDEEIKVEMLAPTELN
jgi:thymidylate synthase